MKRNSRVAGLLAVMVLALGCVGTKTGDRLRAGCAYLAEYKALAVLGTVVIPSGDGVFYAGLTYRNLEHICNEIERIDEHRGSNADDVEAGSGGGDDAPPLDT